MIKLDIKKHYLANKIIFLGGGGFRFTTSSGPPGKLRGGALGSSGGPCEAQGGPWEAQGGPPGKLRGGKIPASPPLCTPLISV